MKEQNKQLTPEEIAQQDWKGLFYDKLMHTAEKPAVHEPEVKTFKFQGFDAADSIPAMGEVTEPVKKSPGFSDEPDSGVKPKDISPAIHMADTEKENPDTFRNYIGQAYKAFNPPASQEPKKPAVQILGDNGPVPLEEAFPDKVHSDTGNMRSETALETRQYLQELVNGNSPEPSDAVLKHMQSLLKGQLTPQQHAEAPAVSGAPTGCVTAQDKRVISPNTGIDCRVNNTVPTAPTGILRDMPQNFSELPQPEAPAVSGAPTGILRDMPLNFSELPQPGAPAAILPQNFSELAAPTDPAGTLNSKGEKKKRGLKKRGLKRAVPAYAGTLNGEEVKKNSGLKNAGTPNGEEVKRTRGLKVMVGAMFAFSVAFGVYCIVSDVMNPQTGGNEQYALATYDKPVEKEREITQNTLMTPAEIAERCLPAIAEIYTFADSFMGSVQGSGSGIVMSSDGLIITNAHVIADADIIKVKISGKREMDAQVIGIDAKTDIAVIKIPASGLPAAELGNSDQVKIGEDVVVLGNPAGLTGSVTNGIVSGINRAMGNGRYEMKYIQTNAAISPGNSGGALLNMYGQVIGITSLKYVSQGYEGLGFAISINDAKPIIEALISDGQITGRTRIGIQFVASGDSESGFVGVFEEYFGKKPPEDLKGLLVSEIDFECDIYNTELRPMDIITKMQDKDIETMDDVSAILDGKKTGDKLTAHVVRFRKDNGERLEFDIEFALMADGE